MSVMYIDLLDAYAMIPNLIIVRSFSFFGLPRRRKRMRRRDRSVLIVDQSLTPSVLDGAGRDDGLVEPPELKFAHGDLDDDDDSLIFTAAASAPTDCSFIVNE